MIQLKTIMMLASVSLYGIEGECILFNNSAEPVQSHLFLISQSISTSAFKISDFAIVDESSTVV